MIDAQPWLAEMKRRVQHFGYKYDYKRRTIHLDMSLGPMPKWMQGLCEALHWADVMPWVSDQVIVNEYKPGQGIASHVDCEPCFAHTIASLSLGGGVVMQLKSLQNQNKKYQLWLEPRSLLVLSNDARYFWQHGIPARKTDVLSGEKRTRTRRLSLTFRKVILSPTFIHK